MNNPLEDLSESPGIKADIYESGQRNGSAPHISEEPLLTPNVKRTSPCRGNRLKEEAREVSPCSPYFPEVVAPTHSHSTTDSSLPWNKSSATQVIKIYNEDNTSRAVEVPSDIVARDICQLFALKSHCIDEHSLTLYEHLSHLGIERTIEDHESIMEVISSWGMDADNRLNLRKNYAKYEFFRKPSDFFPDHMVSISSESNGVVDHSQLVQIFLSSSTCPEIHGHLHTKEPSRKSWKKLYFILRRSGLYVSSKGTSKDPWHLQFITDFTDSNVYTLLSAKKTHGAPTDFAFCVKSLNCTSSRDMKLLCADDEQTRMCWIAAVRLFKRSISENSLVAMDFSGQKSRVIENPSEVLSVAVQEGLAWRRKSCHRLSAHGSPSASQSSLNIALHSAQPWFHGKLSRDEAQRLIIQQGPIDGLFLLRDSQSNPKTFVLSLCHMQKVKHFQILPVDDAGELSYTLDDGHTRFSDLIQLVDFYQLNRGVLPCKLKQHCTGITL
ncbi:growth factor receptor-bound protein 14 isoform X2 [Corythoichthys intestinalis]|uniref:growth factor receptor-bound protein 14 isoform X2 n=1 Tax=Corythoichthys intestinalis TaxID=161448 RepID=UPI0025A55605|nr:growth factor receptor-bound protein 14 isoform X2 [Corythoichthys intestinalis]